MYDRFLKISYVPILTRCVLLLSVLVMILAINGDWSVTVVNLLNEYGIIQRLYLDQILQSTLISERMKNFSYFWITTMCFGYGIYFIIGFFFHWYYYVRQKDQPEKWKCQPKRWLSTELELDEIKAGSVSLFVTNTWSSLMECYVHNGGYCTVYFNWDEYGIVWWILQFPIIFISIDYGMYWVHRIFHVPYLYTRFHKMHHKYKQPTAFSATAIHPVEISCLQMVMFVPLFTVPTHWSIFRIILLYLYYHGIITHSGINFKAKWWQPWQSNTVFHDNHHQYFHVNFGFNFEWWDKLHNTYRKPDRVYNENIFYGKGKPIDEINQEELENEIMERKTESITAHDDNFNPFLIDSSRSK
ncbi:hypothetical protein PGB90_006739 [Kerria lacca]